MNTETVLAPEEVKKIHQQMVFELVSRGNTKPTTIRKDDIGKANPRGLNSPKRIDLPMTSRHHLGKNKGFIKTQYISGANTIYVDDYVDADGNLQPGLKKQNYDLDKERERSIGLNIHFVFGVLDLRKYGEDPNLIEFVNKHEMNAESPAGKAADRTVSRMFQFQPMRKEEKAVKKTVNFDDNLEAMTLVGTLRRKTGDGYEWDTPRINALLNIIGGKTADLGIEDNGQKFNLILGFASTNAPEFLRTIKETLQDTHMGIAKAIQFGILTISSKEALMKIGEGSAPRSIYEYPSGTTEDNRVEALAIHLLGGSSQATNDLNLLTGELEVAKLNEMSTAGKKKK